MAAARRRQWPSPASYEVVEGESDMDRLTIRDLSPERGGRSVTNSAEEVVAELYAAGRLPHGRHLYYYDTAGDLDELLHQDGRFTGFAPGPRRPGVPRFGSGTPTGE